MSAYEATDRALSIIEILAMILAQLPGRKIFTIQCVSKLWIAVIDTSPAIQWKLFLRAKKRPMAPIMCNAEKGWLEYGSQLEFNSIARGSVLTYEWAVLQATTEVSYVTGLEGRGLRSEGEMLSCDRMFLTQPPCTIVEGDRPVNPGGDKSRFRVRNEAGLRCRDLVLANNGAQAHLPDDFRGKKYRSCGYTIWMPIGLDARRLGCPRSVVLGKSFFSRAFCC